MRVFMAALCVVLGGYMFADGVHALIYGEYISPAGVQWAHQLGPWALAVRLAGIDPYSLAMKLAFLVFGAAWLVHAGFVLRDARLRAATTLLAVLTLWYLPAGTVIAVAELVVVWFVPRRSFES